VTKRVEATLIYDGLDMRVLSKADKSTAVDFQI